MKWRSELLRCGFAMALSAAPLAALLTVHEVSPPVMPPLLFYVAWVTAAFLGITALRWLTPARLSTWRVLAVMVLGLLVAWPIAGAFWAMLSAAEVGVEWSLTPVLPEGSARALAAHAPVIMWIGCLAVLSLRSLLTFARRVPPRARLAAVVTGIASVLILLLDLIWHLLGTPAPSPTQSERLSSVDFALGLYLPAMCAGLTLFHALLSRGPRSGVRPRGDTTADEVRTAGVKGSGAPPGAVGS